MKINIKNFIIALVACCAVIWTACGDKATFDNAIIAPDGARVKFIHGISNQATGTAAAAQNVVVFANDAKWSAVLNTIANGPDSIVYGSGFPLNDYAILPGGAINFKLKLPKSLNPDTTILAGSLNLSAGKYYTVVAADTFPNAKFLSFEDDRSVNKNLLKSYYRVINTISGTPADGYDIYVKRQSATGAIATVKFGEASPYFEIDPNTSTVNDSLILRPKGLTTTYAAFSLGTGTFTANRIRNFVLRGNASVGGTRGVRTPTYTLYATN
jgi:hypothetical protein